MTTQGSTNKPTLGNVLVVILAIAWVGMMCKLFAYDMPRWTVEEKAKSKSVWTQYYIETGRQNPPKNVNSGLTDTIFVANRLEEHEIYVLFGSKDGIGSDDYSFIDPGKVGLGWRIDKFYDYECNNSSCTSAWLDLTLYYEGATQPTQRIIFANFSDISTHEHIAYRDLGNVRVYFEVYKSDDWSSTDIWVELLPGTVPTFEGLGEYVDAQKAMLKFSREHDLPDRPGSIDEAVALIAESQGKRYQIPFYSEKDSMNIHTGYSVTASLGWNIAGVWEDSSKWCGTKRAPEFHIYLFHGTTPVDHIVIPRELIDVFIQGDRAVFSVPIRSTGKHSIEARLFVGLDCTNARGLLEIVP